MVSVIAPFEPINQVTPFTYRDNATYLTILSGLRAKLNELILHVDDVDGSLTAKINETILALTEQLETEIELLRNEVIQLITESSDTGIAWDPTNGKLFQPAARAISNVYDNTRIYAYFASEWDALDLTAAEYDAMLLGARHFDLVATYPVIHAVNTL